MKLLISAALALSATASLAIAAEPAPPAPAAPAAEAKAEAEAKILTMESKVGELIDNPKTDAVLKRLLPELRASTSFNKDSRNAKFSDIIATADGIDHGKRIEIEEELDAAQRAKPTAP